MARDFRKELVLAERESMRIATFLNKMVEQGKMTAFERELVRQEVLEFSRQVGELDSNDNIIEDWGDDDEQRAALQKQANHLERKKILELHPDFEQELTQVIEYRQFFPTPPMTPALQKPGEALLQYNNLMQFIMDKRDSGELLRDQAYAAYKPAFEIFEDEGISIDHLSNDTDKLVLMKARHAVVTKLLELCPSLADQLRRLESGRSL